jgi:small subunit ribosomal protein S29
MSSSICARCLWRLQSSRTQPNSSALAGLGRSSFHSSATQYALPAKKKPTGHKSQGPKFREARGATIKKKKKERPRPPAPGERKTARTRIVLSNTNAMEVQGLENLTKDNMLQSEKVGEMLALEGSVIDQLRDVKAFKPSQNWNMFRRPATLMRQESIQLGVEIDKISKEPRTIQRIITGDKKSGKSVQLLQAMSMAFLNKWIVINVPEAQDYTINHSAYAPAPGGEDEQLYVQPQLASDLLTRVVAANGPILHKLPVAQDHSASKLPLSKKMTLKDLANLGSEEVSIAWPTWQALWKELNSKSTGKTGIPPVLFAVDSIDHWFDMTKYRSSDFSPIHAHQFLFIRQFMQLLFHTPAPGLANGGMILAATSGSNNPLVPSFHILLRQLVARANGLNMTDSDFPLPKPYQKVDQRVLDLFRGSEATEVQELKGLTQPEAKGLLEYFARSGVLKEALTDEKIREKWTLSGGGIVGELTKFGSRVRV